MEISVVIPTYNRYGVLKRAIHSVLAQTHKPKEIIIIDDGSNDKTSQIIKEFPQINYYYQENAGVSSARNLGIKYSKSKWIAFLDSDDEWHKDKLQEHIFFHKQHPQVLMSYTDEKWMRDDKEVKLPKKFHKVGGEIFCECLSHCIIAPSATLISKDLLDDIGDFDESLEVCEDYDLWLRVAIQNSIGLIDKKLITKYGGSEDQLSMKYWGMDRFRVLSLEKILSNSKFNNKTHYDSLVKTLVQKYELLKKGAIKHNKISDIKQYEEKLKYLN